MAKGVLDGYIHITNTLWSGSLEIQKKVDDQYADMAKRYGTPPQYILTQWEQPLEMPSFQGKRLEDMTDEEMDEYEKHLLGQ